MKKIVRRILLAAFLVTLAVLMLSSCTKNDGTIEYRSTKGGYEVVGLVDKSASDVVIPNKYNGKDVVAIGDNAFRGTYIASISIPSTVKSFGLNAFEFCSSLKKVELEDARVFAGATFLNEYSNPLSNGAELYEGKNKIENLVLDSENIAEYAYVGALGIKSLTFTGVKSVGTGAFKNCSELSSVNFGDSVESIGTFAFSGAGIVELKLPESVKSVAHSAFSSNAVLKTVVLPTSLSELSDRVFFSCKSLENINLDNVKSIGTGVFYECTSLNSITLSAVTTTIGEHAFYNCGGLETVNIPDTSALEAVGEYAFSGCSMLRDIYLGNAKNLKKIGAHAFEYCVSLENVTVPSSLEELGDWAFASCHMLNLTEKDGVGYIGNDETPYVIVYKHLNDEVIEVNIQTGAKFVHQGAFFGKKAITHIVMPSGVVTVGSQAFSFCTGLKEITFAKTTKSIGDGVLMGCASLEKVRFKGASAQWTDSKNENYVKKGSNWNFNAGSYKIYYG